MKIPAEAKLVFKGEIFDVYQWQQQLFDGTYAIFEALKRPDTVKVFAIQDNKIIIAKEQQPTKPTFYGLFGGRVESGEEPEIAAKRELLEESGLASTNWSLFHKADPLHKAEWSIYYFIAKNCQMAAAKPTLDPGEKIEEVLTLGFEEFIEMIVADKIKDNSLVNKILMMKVQNKLEDFKEQLFGQIKPNSTFK